MPRNFDWNTFAANLVEELAAMPAGRRLLTFRLREILRRAGNPIEPKPFRTRAFWMQVQRGERSGAALTSAGLSISFFPNVKGEPVQEVAFHLSDNGASVLKP